MWNALAGYAGLVSVGQQAFIGFGAYGTILLTQHSVQPYLAVVLAAVASALLAAVLSLLVLRLRGGQFAVGTWVVAEGIALFVMLDQSLGGGTGISLQGLSSYAPDVRRTFTYWLTLGFAVLLLVLLFLLLRHRTGAACRRSATTRTPPPRSASGSDRSNSCSSSSPDSDAAPQAP
ncbi:hypothetical protein OG883_39990 [Streptomyces sp. NBC_01142]|nr:hypothetical protein [Streptomyces sp. NBC_01142]MCX4825887.1 hypothetical protein [Streptomyces sp. NBC_01142]